MGTIRCLLFLALAGAIIYLVFVAAVNVFDKKIDYFNINPSPQTNYKLITLEYPQPPSNAITQIDIDVGAGGKLSTHLPLLSVQILLSYEGYLSERKKVNVTATGVVYNEGKTEVISLVGHNMQTMAYGHYVSIGFEGTSPYNESDQNAFSTGEFIINLEEAPNDTLQSIILKKSVLVNSSLPKYPEITWETQGDYYPYVVVYFNNSSSVRSTFTDYKIHVSGTDIEQQEKYSRINTSLTIVLFVFSLVASMELLSRAFPKSCLGTERTTRDSEDTGDKTTDKGITSPEKQQPDTKDLPPPAVKQKKGKHR